MQRIITLFAAILLLANTVILPAQQTPAADPLASWNEGQAKRAVTDFVARVTAEGGKDFVPPAQRIAVFDNDGTLWAEQPVYFQVAFALDRVKVMAPQHPEWKQKEPFKSILADDLKGALAGGEKAAAEIITITHSGMTTDEFQTIVKDWIRTARHPKYNRPYNQCVYQPMLEVLAYLRANAFKTFIVSGGGVEFMRAFAEETYGIPPEQVIGSSGVVKFELRDGRPVLVKEPRIEFIDDGPGKPVAIHRFIGRHPILAFGNSDGDLQMLQYIAGGKGPHLALIVHHTDGEREYAYDRQSHIGKLDKAWDEAMANGWVPIDMKQDWNQVFLESKPPP